jgi:hypothetical protein
VDAWAAEGSAAPFLTTLKLELMAALS